VGVEGLGQLPLLSHSEVARLGYTLRAWQMTSQPHNGDVVVSRVGQVDGKSEGAEDVRSYRPRKISSLPPGADSWLYRLRIEYRVDLVDDSADPVRRPEGVAAVVGVAGLDLSWPVGGLRPLLSWQLKVSFIVSSKGVGAEGASDAFPRVRSN